MCRTHEWLAMIYWRKVGMTSSPHGFYGLGHIRANPKRLPEFILFYATREHEVGIASNRGSACRGNDILEEGGDDVKSAWLLWARPHTCESEKIA
nr:hypothetical protein [Tanacetum cinerariifolium]